MLVFQKLTALAMFGLGATALTAHASDLTISAQINGSQAVIGASSTRLAGAIDSLTFRGVQYVNAYDHGREIQVAAFYENSGCLNPTEGGSEADGTGNTSSSQLLSSSTANNVLSTHVNMVWWDPPANCGYPDPPGLSNTYFSKSVAFAYNGIPNLIRYDLSVQIPKARTNMFTEATIYSPQTFAKFLAYNQSTRTLTPVTVTANSPNGAQSSVPVIMTTSDGKNAVAEVSGAPLSYYEYFNFTSGNPTAKTSCIYLESNVAAGSIHSFSCPLAIGTVDEVVSALNAYPSATPSANAPVFRFVRSGKHLYTPSYTEGASAGFTIDGTDFHVFPNNGGGAYIALYRCSAYSGSTHFVSAFANCEGKTVEGILGYAAQGASAGIVALYRFHNTAPDYLVTESYSEGTQAGYTYDGIIGYVPN